ncbi:MAG: Mur ligase domain-containing protein [Bacteroidales bacterium]|nr:Mur ligase domain-containing protein [Bacteroidales bacterium]
MRVHFIAIGGSVMHNLALALHHKGFDVTGSDDEFFEPSKSRLAACGLLPKENGWHPERITSELDAVILGMHAMNDNPELKKARELGIKVYSFPEYLYEQTKDKKRIVVGGSHGKTTTTSMIMHVLKTLGKKFDYMVGAQIEGFDTMVGLSKDAPIAVFEGDEYLSSTLDQTSKFLRYKPDVAIITGIAWDHINVFPTWDSYVGTFEKFASTIMPNGKYIYYGGDENLCKIASGVRSDVTAIPYNGLDYKVDGDNTIVCYNGKEYTVGVFGKHNMQDMNAAMLACEQVGIEPEQFLGAIESFSGAAKRLQTLKKGESGIAFLDFAHSPSKLKATTEAVRDRYKDKKLIACMELHTFSSLTKAFLPQYAHTMDAADEAYVYFNPEVIEHKRLEPINADEVAKAFEHKNLKVFTKSSELVKIIEDKSYDNAVILIMTSGNFDGVNIKELANKLIK